MKKSYFILFILVIVGVFMIVSSCSTDKLPSRQQELLLLSEYEQEGKCAVCAINIFNSQPRKFAQCWQNTGDIYQSAVRLLEQHPMKNPKVKRIFRYKSSLQKIFVELEDEGCENLVVGIWNANKKYTVTEIYLANGSSGNE